MIDMQ